MIRRRSSVLFSFLAVINVHLLLGSVASIRGRCFRCPLNSPIFHKLALYVFGLLIYSVATEREGAFYRPFLCLLICCLFVYLWIYLFICQLGARMVPTRMVPTNPNLHFRSAWRPGNFRASILILASYLPTDISGRNLSPSSWRETRKIKFSPKVIR